MECRYCGYKKGSHHSACPSALCTGGAERREIWQGGFNDGRAGKTEMSQNATYLLGYGVGIVALEEAQNGFNPVTEGCQW